MNEMKRVKFVELNNFRTYKGNMKFDLITQSGEIADFAVIYAPNGVGKTSFFDSIEWGITGKINRLENDIGDNKYRGYILRNRYSDSKTTADVKITLENDKYIYRKIRKLTKNQLQDYTSGSKKGNIDEVFKYNNWDSIILPHNRIESFVKDNTGTKKYEYWGSYWDPTGEERKEFEFLYKMKKQAITMAEALNSEVEKNELRIEEFKKTSEIIYNLNISICNYNKLVTKNEKVVCLSLDFTNSQYSLFINKIEIIKKELESKNMKLQNNLIDLSLLDDDFVKEFECKIEDLNRHKYLLDSWTKILSKAKEKSNYIEQYNNLKERILSNDNNIKLLCEISNAGEEWFQSYYHYNDMKLFTNSMLEKRKELQKQIRNLEEEKEKIMQDYNKTIHSKKGLESNKIKLKECEVFVNIIKRKCERNEKWLKYLFDARNRTEKLINLSECIKVEAKNSIISDINEFSVIQLAMTSIKIDDKKKIIDELELLINKKQDVEKKILIEKAKYEAAETISEELSKIIEIARIYINKQHSSTCPVCNEKYDSEEILLSKTNISKNENVMMHLELWNKYKNELKYIDDKIEEVTKKWNNTINSLLEKENINTLKYKKIKERIDLLESNIKKSNQSNRKVYEKYFENIKHIGYFNLELSQELIEIWYRDEYEKNIKSLNEISEKITSIDKETQKNKETLNNLKKEYELKEKERNNFENTSLNLKFMKFIDENKIGYGLVHINNKMDSLKEEVSILNQEYEKIFKNIEVLKRFDSNKISYYKYKVKQLETILKEKNITFNENYCKFRNITGNKIFGKNIIKNKKKKLRKNIEHNNKKLNSISKIVFNMEIQQYYDEKAKLENDLDKLYKDLNKCKKTAKRLNDIYTNAKKVIEEKITLTLNTPLMNDFYRKLEPHPIMKNMKYSLKFNDKDKPELEVLVASENEEYLPEWYFSSAQLNVVALSTFFGRANSVQYSPIDTIFIDDPVGHFDDINILAFVDLLRTMIEKKKKQIIISTHDEVVYKLLRRKLSEEYYNTKFIELSYRD